MLCHLLVASLTYAVPTHEDYGLLLKKMRSYAAVTTLQDGKEKRFADVRTGDIERIYSDLQEEFK